MVMDGARCVCEKRRRHVTYPWLLYRDATVMVKKGLSLRITFNPPATVSHLTMVRPHRPMTSHVPNPGQVRARGTTTPTHSLS